MKTKKDFPVYLKYSLHKNKEDKRVWLKVYNEQQLLEEKSKINSLLSDNGIKNIE